MLDPGELLTGVLMTTKAKTLTLTAAKAPRKSAAPLAVPKTATSYFVETEAAAKVTVVKKRSLLAAVDAASADDATAVTNIAANEDVAVPVVVRKRSKLAARDEAVAEASDQVV